MQGSPSPFEIRIADTPVGMDAIAAAWRDLEHRCASELTYFQTLSWCRNWVEQFAQPGKAAPHIRTAWRDKTLVAVWPLMVVSGPLGVQRLETLGNPHSQYTNMLCNPAEDLASIAEAFLDDLRHKQGADLAVLNAVPSDSVLGRAIEARGPLLHGSDEAAILDLSAFASSEEYTAQLGKLQKRNRNRRRNHLARLGELDFAVLWPGDPDYRRHLATCVAMKRRWLAEHSRYSTGFAYEGYEAFLASLEGDAHRGSGACLSVLTCGGRAVAVEFGFIRNRHYYAYIGAFDWDLREHSPGKVQMDMTVCWLIDNGVQAYDLLGNAADYKASWTNRTVPLRALTIPLSWRGRLYAQTWVRRVKPAGKRLYAAMPAAVRGLALGRRGMALPVAPV